MEKKNKKYRIQRQYECGTERDFVLIDEDGYSFIVDIYTDGGLTPPKTCLRNNKSFSKWLRSLVGKEVEIEEIYPLIYATGGVVKILDAEKWRLKNMLKE